MNLARCRFQEQNNAITHDIVPFLFRYEVELFPLYPSLFSFATVPQCDVTMWVPPQSLPAFVVTGMYIIFFLRISVK